MLGADCLCMEHMAVAVPLLDRESRPYPEVDVADLPRRVPPAFRAASDRELVRVVRGMVGVVLDRDSLQAHSATCYSAQQVAEGLTREQHLSYIQQDRLWAALATLWERWQPGRPSREMVDEWVARGHAKEGQRAPLEACRAWLQAWSRVRKIRRQEAIATYPKLRAVVGGATPLKVWLVKLLDTLFWHLSDDRPDLLAAAAELVQDLQELADLHPVLARLCRALQGSLLFRQDRDADALRHFERWLQEAPTDGEAYLRYEVWLELAEAEAVLRSGLAACEADGDPYLLHRLRTALARVLTDQGRHREAEEVAGGPGSPDLPGPQPTVGSGCPCGSRQAFGACCGGPTFAA